MSTAVDDMTATASTPDGRIGATVHGRDAVDVTMVPGYYAVASEPELSVQLSALARALFVERTRAYYRARSLDFGYLITKEEPMLGSRDQAYAEQRSGIVATGEAAGGDIRITTAGLTSWSVELTPGVLARWDERSFCAAVGHAAGELIRSQLAQSVALKRRIYP